MKRKFILIDTVSCQDSKLSFLDRNFRKIGSEFKAESRKLFSILKKVLKSETNSDQLQGISVINGPGEFTSVRQGVVFGNALAWALNLPLSSSRIGETLNIKKQKVFNIVEPVYLRPPNITKSR